MRRADTHETASRRAERLRLLLDLASADGAAALTLGDGIAHDDADAREAVALANACLDAERTHRRRQWRELQRLLALVPPHGGELRDVLYLPGDAMPRALRSAHVLGWHAEPPDDPQADDSP